MVLFATFAITAKSLRNSSVTISTMLLLPLNFLRRAFPDLLWNFRRGDICAKSLIDPISCWSCSKLAWLLRMVSQHLRITFSAFSFDRNQFMVELLKPTPKTVPFVTDSKALSAFGQFGARGIQVCYRILAFLPRTL